jgi:hypothetical protein
MALLPPEVNPPFRSRLLTGRGRQRIFAPRDMSMTKCHTGNANSGDSSE